MHEAGAMGERILKGAVSGLIGGLAAAFVMGEFQSFLSRIKSDQGSNSQKSNGKNGGKSKHRGNSEPATVKAAEMISEDVLDHHLSSEEKRYAGPVMHYAMGGTSGLIYGATAEVLPMSTVGSGLGFGIAVWMLADNLAVPALEFSKSPTQVSFSRNAYALAAPLVYGLMTEAVRGVIRRNAFDGVGS